MPTSWWRPPSLRWTRRVRPSWPGTQWPAGISRCSRPGPSERRRAGPGGCTCASCFARRPSAAMRTSLACSSSAGTPTVLAGRPALRSPCTCRPTWCCARSATGACRFRAYPSMTSAASSRTPLAGSFATALLCLASTSAGWIKRGPSGVIGTNKHDATETVHCLLQDAPALPRRQVRDPDGIVDLLHQRGVRVVPWQGWEAIEALEIAAGR